MYTGVHSDRSIAKNSTDFITYLGKMGRIFRFLRFQLARSLCRSLTSKMTAMPVPAMVMASMLRARDILESEAKFAHD